MSTADVLLILWLNMASARVSRWVVLTLFSFTLSFSRSVAECVLIHLGGNAPGCRFRCIARSGEVDPLDHYWRNLCTLGGALAILATLAESNTSDTSMGYGANQPYNITLQDVPEMNKYLGPSSRFGDGDGSFWDRWLTTTGYFTNEGTYAKADIPTRSMYATGTVRREPNNIL